TGRRWYRPPSPFQNTTRGLACAGGQQRGERRSGGGRCEVRGRHGRIDRRPQRVEAIGDVVPATKGAVVALVALHVGETHRGGAAFGEERARRRDLLAQERVLDAVPAEHVINAADEIGYDRDVLARPSRLERPHQGGDLGTDVPRVGPRRARHEARILA